MLKGSFNLDLEMLCVAITPVHYPSGQLPLVCSVASPPVTWGTFFWCDLHSLWGDRVFQVQIGKWSAINITPSGVKLFSYQIKLN